MRRFMKIHGKQRRPKRSECTREGQKLLKAQKILKMVRYHEEKTTYRKTNSQKRRQEREVYKRVEEIKNE